MVVRATSSIEPGPEEKAHSSRLVGKIRDELDRNDGWLSFERYMDMALYTPGLGYYSAGLQKFGAQGDYITAPLIGNLMAKCLAVQFGEILERLTGIPERTIVEFGAGNGKLTCDLLESLSEMDNLPERYLVIETSADLKSRQRQAVARLLPDIARRVEWLDALPDSNVEGIIFANELLDAMPVMKFEIANDGQVMEQGVEWVENHFRWHENAQTVAAGIQERISRYQCEPGFRSEIGRVAEGWVRTVSRQLKSGALILVDYGFPGHEFYHPDRLDGTLMCHYRHHALTDPFRYPGLQDITAHVDFSAIAAAGREADLDLAGYCGQGSFLLSLDLLAILESENSSVSEEAARLALAQEVKKLTMPHEMGELFKVIGFTRSIPNNLKGFSLSDRSGSL